MKMGAFLLLTLLVLGLACPVGVFAGGRMYDPSTGRFTSPDPMLDDLPFMNIGANAVAEAIDRKPRPGGNSADFNPYVGMRNNPLRYRDPSGNFVVDATTDGNVQGSLSGSAAGAAIYRRLDQSSMVYVFQNSNLGLNTNGTTWFTNSNTVAINIDPSHGLRPDTLFHEATHGWQFDTGWAPTNSSYTSGLMQALEGYAYGTENNAYGLATSCQR